MPFSKHKTNTNTREFPPLLFLLSCLLLFNRQLLQQHVTFENLLFQMRPRALSLSLCFITDQTNNIKRKKRIPVVSSLSLSYFRFITDQTNNRTEEKKANSSCFFLALNRSPCGPMCRAAKPKVLDSQQRTHLVGCVCGCPTGSVGYGIVGSFCLRAPVVRVGENASDLTLCMW